MRAHGALRFIMTLTRCSTRTTSGGVWRCAVRAVLWLYDTTGETSLEIAVRTWQPTADVTALQMINEVLLLTFMYR